MNDELMVVVGKPMLRGNCVGGDVPREPLASNDHVYARVGGYWLFFERVIV